MENRIRVLAISLALALGSSACSVPSRPTQQMHREGGEFTMEDKKAARALSIGNELEAGINSPQFEAVLCGLALTEIADRLQGDDLLTAEQQRALARAQSVYQRRATAGQSSDKIEKIRRDVDAAYPDGESRARFAVTCLRRLMSTN